MKYKSTIKVYGDAKKLAECFKAEENKKVDRSRFILIPQADYILFEIEADDSTALRATFNSITKLFTVFEKMEDIKNG